MEQTEYLQVWKALRLFQGNFGFTYGNKQTLHYFKTKKKISLEVGGGGGRNQRAWRVFKSQQGTGA